jgi:hypothetical protein
MAAERLIDRNAPAWHGSSDDEEAASLARNNSLGPPGGFVDDDDHLAFREELRARAEKLVRRHRRAIAALAEKLLAETSLTGDQVRVFLREQGYVKEP